MSSTDGPPKVGRAALRPDAPAAALPPLRAPRLLDQVRERARLLHYSLRTEQAYVQWCRSFIRYHGLRHPAQIGGAAVHSPMDSMDLLG